MSNSISIQDRCYGSFFGAAVGDALMSSIEFKSRRFCQGNPITDMDKYNHNFDLPPGFWTDDTSMCLCLAQSLIDNNGKINQFDQVEKYTAWFRHGYMSSNDVCFDIGRSTRNSILQFEKTGNYISIFDLDKFSGNGGIMRLTPIMIAFRNKSIQECMIACEQSSKTTHSSKIAIDAAKILGSIIYNIYQNVQKENLLEQLHVDIDVNDIHDSLLDIYTGRFINKTEEEIETSGYSVHTLEAALYSFFKFDNYTDSILYVGNLGNDTDTVACVTGQICGAYYGIYNIRTDWIQKLAKQELLWQVIDDLYSLDAPLQFHEELSNENLNEIITISEKALKLKFNPNFNLVLSSQGNFLLVKNDTLEVALKYKHLNPLILIFADDKNPGGTIISNMQEESLFKRSNLHEHLTTDLYPLNIDEAILTKRVQTFGANNSSLLDFIACATSCALINFELYLPYNSLLRFALLPFFSLRVFGGSMFILIQFTHFGEP
jgi:ADP-ribosyl-[dinitrogen reductase] hydrolase